MTDDEDMHDPRTDRMFQRAAESIEDATRLLIELVRRTERFEKGRSSSARLTLEIELADGTPETWHITIKRAPQ